MVYNLLSYLLFKNLFNSSYITNIILIKKLIILSLKYFYANFKWQGFD
jgi:hypothetical protein